MGWTWLLVVVVSAATGAIMAICVVTWWITRARLTAAREQPYFVPEENSDE